MKNLCKCYNVPSPSPKMKKKNSVGDNVEELELTYIAGGKVK
jgi:hypothetical protein